MIEIGFSCDEGYAMATGVCITSIFESNRDNKVRVHILTNGFSKETLNRFEQTAKKYNQSIEIYNIDTTEIGNLHIRSGSHVTSMAYARLQFPYVLENSIEKLLYLDGDMIVIGNLEELWNTNINNYYCLAVPDLFADDIVTHNRIGVYDKPYVNSGMLVMNLRKWRNEKITEKCIEFIKGYPKDNPFHDQDAINGVLGENIGLIHPKYNFITSLLFRDRKKLSMHKKRWHALDEAQNNPVVIHYAAPIKPWHKEFNHPIISYFLENKKKSFWSDSKITRKYKGLDMLIRNIVPLLRKLKQSLRL